MNLRNRIFEPKSFLLLALTAFFIPYIIWFLRGENSYVLIHDNLDDEFDYIAALRQSGTLFNYSSDAMIPNLMNGIPRIFFRSGLNLTFLFFHFFSPINAYIVNHLVVHLIGFSGMY